MRIFLALLLLTCTLWAEKTEVYWIDVRTQAEFDQGHLKEAFHIPYQNIAKEISKVTQNKNAKIKVYCKVGGRAGIALNTLTKMGYKNVSNEGGYLDILKEKKE